MAYVKEEALQKREPLVQGAELNIDGKGGKFLIRELIGAGGTSLVYDAVLVRADGSRVTGVLKEFYPQVTAGTSYNFSMLLRYMTVRRKPNGTLAIPAELRDGQRKRLEEVDSLLHEIKSEGLGLRHFIPNMEVFTCGKVPYIFTAESYSGETLAQFCKEQAWANPTSTSLRQILNTVYALACADAQLCAAGAMLLDIKPENILMVYRSTPNGLRKDAFLDTVSLFDVESVVLKSQVGSKDLMLPFSAGFTAPELGGYMSSARRNIGESADVYAMAATLFYCLTQKLVWLDTAQGYAEALQNGPFGAVLTDEQRTALGSLLARALVYEPEHRMQAPEAFAVMMEKVLHTERSMITLQELLRSTSVTVDQYKEAIYFCVATDTSQVDESKKESYCDACVTALIHLMKYTAPSTDDPKAFCLDLIQLQLTLHLTLYPNFVSSKFVIACAALAELYPLSAKEFAKPVLQMAEKFHSFNTFDLKQIGFGRRRQVSDLPKCLQDLCLFFYSEISVYWSLAVTAESNAERQLIARAAIKKASTLAYLPCHADIDLKLLDLIHIAYTDGIQKSDLYRYDSQTFNIIISGETGELLCKYDES